MLVSQGCGYDKSFHLLLSMHSTLTLSPSFSFLSISHPPTLSLLSPLSSHFIWGLPLPPTASILSYIQYLISFHSFQMTVSPGCCTEQLPPLHSSFLLPYQTCQAFHTHFYYCHFHSILTVSTSQIIPHCLHSRSQTIISCPCATCMCCCWHCYTLMQCLPYLHTECTSHYSFLPSFFKLSKTFLELARISYSLLSFCLYIW